MDSLAEPTCESLIQAGTLLEPRGHGAVRAKQQTRRRAVLSRTVIQDVVPRLVLAHRFEASPLPVVADRGEVVEIAGRLLANDLTGARGYAERLLEDGTSIEALSLDILAPAARRLGALWCADDCDFVAVSLGVWHLQQLLHGFGPRFPSSVVPAPERSVLLVPMPGEQHSFGAQMLAPFFRAAGWGAISTPVSTVAALAALLRGTWFSLIGLSLSATGRLPELAGLIRVVRRESRNPAIGVMVGGWMFNEQPDLVRLVGADTTARDARHAPRQAERLMDLMTSAE